MFAIFHKILLSKSVCRKFSIIKVFLKNVIKLIERYIYGRLFFNKVEGCRLKIKFGGGALLWILQNSYERLFGTWANYRFWCLGISLCRNIFCNVHIKEMHSFLQDFGINSFQIDFRILNNLRGVLRTVTNIYDAKTLHYWYLARF